MLGRSTWAGQPFHAGMVAVVCIRTRVVTAGYADGTRVFARYAPGQRRRAHPKGGIYVTSFALDPADRRCARGRCARGSRSGQDDRRDRNGVGQANPQAPLTNVTIAAAVESATKTAAKLAIKNAREYALVYADAAGVTLGPVVSVSDSQNGGGFASYGPGPFFGGPFGGPIGPNQFCGVVTPRTLKQLRHNPQVTIVNRKHRRVCFVPPFANDTLTVTYSAS